MVEYKECPVHGPSSFRNEECLNCRPIETFNLNGSSPMPGILAKIATHLETYGKITVVCSALADIPGVSAMILGEAVERTGKLNENG